MNAHQSDVAWSSGAHHVTALDGLRGCAVLLVMAYHCEYGGGTLESPIVRMLTGGWAGVDIFFVLSGFLITDGLLGSVARQQDLRTFYKRRIRRLAPAAAVFTAIWAALALTGLAPAEWPNHPGTVSTMWMAFAPALGLLTLSYNWWAASDAPTPYGMGQLWSLTVEEQFYLVWPSVVARAFRRPEKALDRLIVWACLIALFSLSFTTWATVTHHQFFAYFSTPTRVFGLALGVAIALQKARRPVGGAVASAFGVRAVGLVGLLLLGALSLSAKDTQVYLVPVIAGSAALVVWAVTIDSELGRTWLRWRWLQWCGRRSYGLYLWHGFCLMMCQHFVGIGWQSAIWSVAAAFTCAAVSWRVVEQRFLANRPSAQDDSQSPGFAPRFAEAALVSSSRPPTPIGPAAP